MKHTRNIILSVVLLMIATVAVGQQDADAPVNLSPGIKADSMGQVSIGDITAEVCHFDTNWSVTEQHDVFTPAAHHAPTTQPGSHVIAGVFTSASGPFNLTEKFDPADGGVKWTATATSDKEVGTNELYVSLSLPTDSFAGKQITVDQQAVPLPAAPAKQGESGLFDSDSAQKILIKTATGTLTITGDLNLHLQDDREWNNDRYSLRLNFAPSSGQIKDSRVELTMKFKPTAG